ncbi:MAG: polymer-forming cytoskeletal protein [Spirochaetia bacterium]|nr:polymer-forming cytoskeletal protein [Spirochaetia bacterium]
MTSRKTTKKPLLFSTVLSKNIKASGDLLSSSSILIEGRFDGTMKTSSHVGIAKTADASFSLMECGSAELAGHVSGRISAKEFIEALPKATISADLTAPIVRIPDSCTFEGTIHTSMIDRP